MVLKNQFLSKWLEYIAGKGEDAASRLEEPELTLYITATKIRTGPN